MTARNRLENETNAIIHGGFDSGTDGGTDSKTDYNGIGSSVDNRSYSERGSKISLK